MKLTYDGSV